MRALRKEAIIFYSVVAGIALIPVSAAYGQQMGLPISPPIPRAAMTPVQTQSQAFFPRLLDSIRKTQTSTLWSTYPANIRGQVFGNTQPSLSPSLMSGGGW